MADKWSNQAKGCFGFAFGVLTGVVAASSVVLFKKKTSESYAQTDDHTNLTLQIETMRAQAQLERDRYNKLSTMSKTATQLKSSRTRKKQVQNTAQNRTDRERYKGLKITPAHQFPIGNQFPARTRHVKNSHMRQHKSRTWTMKERSKIRGSGVSQLAASSPIRSSLARVEEEHSADEMSDAEENLCSSQNS